MYCHRNLLKLYQIQSRHLKIQSTFLTSSQGRDLTTQNGCRGRAWDRGGKKERGRMPALQYEELLDFKISHIGRFQINLL
jgi:hypothetical protein